MYPPTATLGAYNPPAQVPVPPPLVSMQYTPVFHTGGVPPPLSPVIEPLPDVQRQAEREEKNKELQAKEASVAAQPRNTGWDSFVGVLSSAALGIEKGVTLLADEIDSGIRAQNFESAQKNWRAAFRLDPNKDRLWREYTCKCISGTNWFSGSMYISDFYLGFYGDKFFKNNVQGATPNGWTYRLVFLIPLHNILSIQLGESKSMPNDAPPVINMSTIMNKLPHPDSIMIFTAEGSLHNFYGFYNFDHCYNVLDHAWRASFMDNRQPPQPIPLDQTLPSPPLLKDPPTSNPVKTPPSTTLPASVFFPQPYMSTVPPSYPGVYPPSNTFPSPYPTVPTNIPNNSGYPAGYPPGYY